MTTAAARPRRRARRGEGELLRAEILTAARELLDEEQDADAVSVRAVETPAGRASRPRAIGDHGISPTP